VTQGTSSSCRVGVIRDAVISQHHRSVGPIRLPETRREEFISDFNRIYAAVGIVLHASSFSGPKKIPDDVDVVEDSVLDD